MFTEISELVNFTDFHVQEVEACILYTFRTPVTHAFFLNTVGGHR